MGFFDSSSQATDNRQAVTDQGVNFGRNVAQYVQSGGVGVASNGTLLGVGANQIKNVKGNVTITSADPAVAQAAMDNVTRLSALFGTDLSTFITKANEANLNLAATNSQALQTTTDSVLAAQAQSQADAQNNFQTTLGKMISLATNAQPAGETLKTNIVFWITLAALGLVGVVLYRKMA
ncbi:MAG: hypothetical protein WCQ21_31235 [Verrucomicrobiota bacterium]